MTHSWWRKRSLEERFSAFWNHPATAIVLLSIGAAFVAIALTWPQSPGVCIGVLATAAGIMSARSMKIFEKLVWVILLVTFAVLEVRAIGRADSVSLQNKTAETQKFQDIAESLDNELKTTAAGFKATGDGIALNLKALQDANDQSRLHFDSASKQADENMDLAQKNLAVITGAGSVPCVMIQKRASDKILFILTAVGENILNPVRVRITEFGGMGDFPLFEQTFQSVSQTEPIEITDHLITPTYIHQGVAAFVIHFSTPNGPYREELQLRKDPAGWSWRNSQYVLYKETPNDAFKMDRCERAFGDSIR